MLYIFQGIAYNYITLVRDQIWNQWFNIKQLIRKNKCSKFITNHLNTKTTKDIKDILTSNYKMKGLF